MKKIIFHIGTYKTATTSIQDNLYSNRDKLKELSILYPLTGLYMGDDVGFRHGKFVWLHNENYEKWKNSLVKDLIEEIRLSNCNTSILSYEGWSIPWGWPALRELVNEFKLAGIYDIEIIGYIRNFDKYAQSYYREFARRRGHKEDFPKFIKYFKGFDYARLITEMQNLSESARFYYFDRIEDIGNHFFSIYDIVHLYKPSEKRNIGISAIDCEIARQLNIIEKPVKYLDDIKRYIRESGLIIDDRKFSEPAASSFLQHTDQYQKELKKMNVFTDDEILDMFNPLSNNISDIQLLAPIIKYFIDKYFY